MQMTHEEIVDELAAQLADSKLAVRLFDSEGKRLEFTDITTDHNEMVVILEACTIE
jgi:hypothetical protein